MSVTNEYKASEILKSLFSNLEHTQFDKATAILNGWSNAVLSACNDGKNSGQKLVDHSRVLDLKNNILHIETDHSGWIQLFTFYQKPILNELQKKFPDLHIRALSFRLQNK